MRASNNRTTPRRWRRHALGAVAATTLLVLAMSPTAGAAPSVEAVDAVSFGPRVDYTAPHRSVIAVGDLDADGRTDIAMASLESVMTVLSARPDGGYDRADYPAGRAGAIAIGDLDGDGRLDIVTGEDRDIVTWLAQPEGGYESRHHPTGAAISDLALADFDADGRVDIVSASGSRQVTISYARPGGTYSSLDLHLRPGSEDVAVSDFDGDGRADFVVTASRSGTVQVMLTRPGGLGFRRAIVKVGEDPGDVAAGDLDGDGRPDIATTSATDNAVDVIVQRPGGGYTRTSYVLGGGTPASAAIADLDADGTGDIAVGTGSPSGQHDRLTVMLGRPAGSFQVSTYPLLPDSHPGSVAVGEMTGDGLLDVTVGNAGQAYVSVLPQAVRGAASADEKSGSSGASNPASAATPQNVASSAS